MLIGRDVPVLPVRVAEGKTLRVGVPDWVNPRLLRCFPQAIELVTLAREPQGQVPIDFWVPPLFPEAAHDTFLHLEGVRVAQSLLAGVEGLLKVVPPEVQICDAQGVHNVATAEWVVAAILGMLKYLPFYSEIQTAGDWSRRDEADQVYHKLHGIEEVDYPPILVEELEGKTVLIVGYGSIGKSIEERLAPFGVELLRVARQSRPGVEPVSALHDLLPLADIVVLIVPHTTETTGMIAARELTLMRRGALVVNAARGPVVDTNALVTALYSGSIRAALDVTDPEPLPRGHPLWSAPNLLITPHVAGSSPLFMQRAFTFAAQQVERYLAGTPLLNVVVGEY